MNRQFVGEIKHKGWTVKVTHDKRYRYYVELDGIETQKALNGNECIRWLLNAMYEEPKIIVKEFHGHDLIGVKND